MFKTVYQRKLPCWNYEHGSTHKIRNQRPQSRLVLPWPWRGYQPADLQQR
uniref:Uncharacterized protein n=1 Tax=Anguilla anguilla TaxID=7936 RepID=A0A0E9W8G1_ANGAN